VTKSNRIAKDATVLAWEDGYFSLDDDVNPHDDEVLSRYWHEGRQDGILDRNAYYQLKKSAECKM